MNPLTNSHEIEQTEEVSIGDLLYKFVPYWPFFIILVVFTVTGAWIYLRYKMPVYQTTASILIKDDKSSTPASELQNAFDMFGAKKNVENEVEVLQSKTLMKQVVKNLHLYAPVFSSGRVIHQSAYERSPIIVEAKFPDRVQNIKVIHFSYNSKLGEVEIHNSSYPLNQWVTTQYGILRFLPNPYFKSSGKVINEKSIDYFFSLVSVKNSADQVLSQVNITPSSKQSTVIDLSIQGEVPKRGEDILNELLKVYKEAAILDKNQLAANTLKFVNERLALVSSDLDSVERVLQNFKSKNQITDISGQGQIYLQTVAANDQKISDINVQLAILNQVEEYVKNKGDLGGIVPAIGDSDPVLKDLLQKLSELELQYTQTKRIVPENNPAVISLVDGINKIKPQVLENIKSQRRNLLAGRGDLVNNSSGYNSILKTIPEKERELLSISRQQAIKNNIYTFLLQKREETALSFASAVADSRIIDHAESSDVPFSPKRTLIYLAAFLGAIVLGVIIVYLKDILTRTVQQRSDISKFTDIPFLGEVNFDRSKTPFVISEGRRSYIAEQFRQLRTSLGYMGIDESHKKILLTSSISGEGKSFIAINLGISLALMGKKVALLELDLRKPKLSEQFDISRKEGLSNFLIGKLQAEDVIKKTRFENLSLLPSGPIPPNPSELISNGKLKELISYLEQKFDYIIMDTAPVNPVTDALIISPLANVTLFVIRHDYTPKIFLQKLGQQNKINNLNNPAFIYNGVRGKGVNKYGYGYGYGYGYTKEDKEDHWLRRILKW
ncbi:MAG: polysaccharide biosynthesis tyrosine autokinase [Ginsengibacter sp.]